MKPDEIFISYSSGTNSCLENISKQEKEEVVDVEELNEEEMKKGKKEEVKQEGQQEKVGEEVQGKKRMSIGGGGKKRG